MKIDLSPAGIVKTYLQTVFPKEKIVCIENFNDEGVSVFFDRESDIPKDEPCDFLVAPLKPTVQSAAPVLAGKWIICFKTEIPQTNDEPAFIDYEEFRTLQWLAASKYFKRNMEQPQTQIFRDIEEAASFLPVVVSQMRIIEANEIICDQKNFQTEQP